MEELLGEIFNIVKSQINLKNLDFCIDVDISLINEKFVSDYTRLKQVILNILLNSIQFTMMGTITMQVSLISRNPLSVEFVIKDTGIGMDQKKLEALLIKLKGGENNKNMLNSTGYCLGLKMSQNIASLLGKNQFGLEIMSKVDEGTTVRFVVNDQSNQESPAILHEIKTSTFINEDFKQEINQINIINNNEIKIDMDSCKKKRVSISTNQKAIWESSKLFEEIRIKNQLQKVFKESGNSCILSDNESSAFNMDKVLQKYNFEIKNASKHYNTMGVYKITKLIKKETLEYLEIPKNHNFKNSNFLSKTMFSLHNTAILRDQKKLNEHDKSSELHSCKSDKIMIVDDDAFNLLSLELILKGFDLKCDKALNGIDAINKLKNVDCKKNCFCEYKLIFMDYQMPMMDGVEATIQICNLINETIKNIPLLDIISDNKFYFSKIY